MSKRKKYFGAWGEQTASQYLEGKGYIILARNVRTEYGEIDLVAKQQGEIIFVEVKTRNSAEFGFPEEAVTELKQQHLLDAAESFLQSHPELNGDWRIDVISIERTEGKPLKIVHFENALGE